MAAPLISVVLVCKDPGLAVRRAVESILTQEGVEKEIVIIDGASTDGTAKWLKSSQHRFSHLVSETDTGVYDAMNKGAAAARGEWIYFIGADDRLTDARTLSLAGETLSACSCAVVGGSTVYSDGREYVFSLASNPRARNFLHHQAAFYRRELFSRFGGFDATLRIMGDYDFNLRLLKNQVSFREISLRIAVCQARGLSDSGHLQGYLEEIRVRHRHFLQHRCLIWDFISVCRFLRKRAILTGRQFD